VDPDKSAYRKQWIDDANGVYGYKPSELQSLEFHCISIPHILIFMPLPNEVQQHIRSTIAAKDDQLIREMNVERREAAAELAAKGLSNSSVRVHRDIDAIERFIEKRMTAHVEIYLDTLAELGIKVDPAIEVEIVQKLGNLKTAQNAAMPPGMGMMTVPSMREMYRSRLGSADARALSSAKNRVRMARLKDAIPASIPQPLVVSHTHHYSATGPNARVNVGSVDNSSNTAQAVASPGSPETTDKQGWTSSDQLAVALFCLSGLVAVVSIWMEKTPVWAAGTVCAMVLLVIYPVHHFIRLWKRKVPVLIVIWGLIALFGWKIWPHPVTATLQPEMRNESARSVANTRPPHPSFQPEVQHYFVVPISTDKRNIPPATDRITVSIDGHEATKVDSLPNISQAVQLLSIPDDRPVKLQVHVIREWTDRTIPRIDQWLTKDNLTLQSGNSIVISTVRGEDHNWQMRINVH